LTPVRRYCFVVAFTKQETRTMTALAKQDRRELARPLKTLEKLIKDHIAAGDKAGVDYYRQAGEELNEARDGHYEGDPQGFWIWAGKAFPDKSRNILNSYMGLAASTSPKSFKSLSDYLHRERGYKDNAPTGRLRRDWTTPIDDIAERARSEARRLAAQEEISRAEEREAEAKLGRRLIDIGFKVLARELHPDKGGSREAMQRLSRVRDRLRANV
jgi:hypothetical protein